MGNARILSKKQITSLFLLGLLVLTGGCATVNVPSIGSEGYRIEDDEKRLMNRAKEAIKIIEDSGAVYPDRTLDEYLNGLLKEILVHQKFQMPEDIQPRIRVIVDPTINAFAFPNGAIYVHTGILAVIENEAQLVTLLGHELTHVIERHVLKQFRSIHNKTVFWGVMIRPLDLVSGGFGSLFGELTFLSTVSGYSQEIELEADREGYRIVKAMGYDVRESKKVFEHMEVFNKNEEIKVPYFFSSHPRTVERIRNFDGFIQNDKNTTITRIDDNKYQKLIHPVLIVNVENCLAKGYFKTAEISIDRLVRDYSNDARGYFLRGELYRKRQDKQPKKKKRDKTADFPAAIEAYTQALAIDPNLPDAYLSRGRTYAQINNQVSSKSDFMKYLELKPQAPEKAYIEGMVKETEKK